MPTNFPLTLDNTRSMEAFFIGIEDKRVRDGLKSQKDVPPEVAELVAMVEDETFLSMATDVVEKMRGVRIESIARADTPIKLTAPSVTPNLEKSDVTEMQEKGREINTYLEQKYPHGIELLKRYATASLGQKMRYEGWTAINLDAAANAEALVNAAVYANVAVATMAVVAAAAVVVIAAVV